MFIQKCTPHFYYECAFNNIFINHKIIIILNRFGIIHKFVIIFVKSLFYNIISFIRTLI